MGNTGISGELSLEALLGVLGKNPTVHRSLSRTGMGNTYNTEGILGGNPYAHVWKQ